MPWPYRWGRDRDNEEAGVRRIQAPLPKVIKEGVIKEGRVGGGILCRPLDEVPEGLDPPRVMRAAPILRGRQ